MPSAFTLQYVEMVKLQNRTENSASSILGGAPKVMYGRDEFGACSKCAAAVLYHRVYGPGTAEGFGLIEFNVLVHCEAHQLTQLGSRSAGSSTWPLLQHVLAVRLSGFGVAEQAGKGHVNVSFLSFGQRLGSLVYMALD